MICEQNGNVRTVLWNARKNNSTKFVTYSPRRVTNLCGTGTRIAGIKYDKMRTVFVKYANSSESKYR